MPVTSLRASYDTRASISSTNANFGEERFLAVRPSANNQDSYLYFAGLPELGSIIVSATLRVWLSGTTWTSGGPHDITVRRVEESWKESQLTYSNSPGVSAVEATASGIATGDGTSVDINVTTLMSNVMSGSPWFGMRLSTTTGTVQRNIYSSEATNPDFRPLLLVEWSSLPDAPVDVSPSGAKAVSLQKPVLTWNFMDADGDAQSALQVQIEDNGTVQADGSFVSPEYDSGWVASTLEEFDLSLAGTGGALPTFVAAGTVASGTGDVTPGLPAGLAVNDVLFLFTESEATDPAPAAPSGYSSVNPTVTAGGTRLSSFWKRATSVEAAPTVTDVGDHLLARMVAYRGCALTGNPWEFVVSSTEAVSDTSGSITGGTTTSANDLIVLVASSDFDPGADDTAGYSAFTNASLGSLTERTDNRAAAGAGGTLAVADGTKATVGATGATTYTLANAGQKAHLAIALQPTGSYGGSYAGVSADAQRWWIVRTRDTQGNTSPWSDVTSFVRKTKGALTITSPPNAGTVEETSPPIVTSLSTRNQVDIAYILEEFDSTNSVWKELWRQDRRAAPTTAGSNYNFGIPDGYIKKTSTNYRLTVRSWDDQDRDGTPGDKTYVEAQSTFTFVRSATPAAVPSLTAAQEANNGPGVELTWTRSAVPDYFALMVNGERVLTRIDPATVFVSGTTYTMTYYGAEPYDSNTYEVEAVVVSSGVLKHSQSNDTEVFTSKPVGIWLMDDSDPPYKPTNQPRKVLFRTATATLGISRSGTTYKPVGRKDPVQVVDATGGYEGNVTGTIWGTDPDFGAANYIGTFRWMTRQDNVGRRFRLIAGGLSIPVELGVVDQFAPRGDVTKQRAYDVSFEVFQVAEFREIE